MAKDTSWKNNFMMLKQKGFILIVLAQNYKHITSTTTLLGLLQIKCGYKVNRGVIMIPIIFVHTNRHSNFEVTLPLVQKLFLSAVVCN